MVEEQQIQGIKVPFGEGASFFVVSNEKKQEAIQLKDIELISSASVDTLIEKLKYFLIQNKLKASEIDIVVFGRNGDSFDNYYDNLTQEFFENTLQLSYKHLSGEFYTASAFGFWIGHEILKRQEIPQALITLGEPKKGIKNILLYNQFKGKDHSFILLTK
jgi:hypothetical protein